MADRGYDADWFRDGLQAKEITPCIPGRKSRNKNVKHDKHRYKRRNRIEIMFGRLKDWRPATTGAQWPSSPPSLSLQPSSSGSDQRVLSLTIISATRQSACPRPHALPEPSDYTGAHVLCLFMTCLVEVGRVGRKSCCFDSLFWVSFYPSATRVDFLALLQANDATVSRISFRAPRLLAFQRQCRYCRQPF